MESFDEICGSGCQQLFAIFGQSRQTHQLRERRPIQRPHLWAKLLCLLDDTDTDLPQLTRRVERRHEADEGIDQAISPAFVPQQVVDIVQALGQVVLLAPGGTARHLNDASVDEADEVSAALARLHPGPVRDFLCGRRSP